MKTRFSASFSVIVALLGICLFALLLLALNGASYSDHVRGVGTFWGKLLNSPPNEIGDALAGIFGTLAFAAAAVAVVMQSFELRAQRQELKLTREVMHEQTLASEEMARAMSAQAEVFKRQQLERSEDRAEQLFDEKLRSLITTITELGGNGLIWHFSNSSMDDELSCDGQITSYSIGGTEDEDLVVDDAILSIRRRILTLHQKISDARNQCIDWRLPRRSEVLPSLLDDIQAICEMKDRLSEPQQERLSRMNFVEVHAELEKINQTQEFWEAEQ